MTSVLGCPPVPQPLRHRLLDSMLSGLPPAGSDWPAVQRVDWLRAFAHAADLIYGPEAALEITVAGATQ